MEMTTQSTTSPPRAKLEDVEAQQVDEEDEETRKQRGVQTMLNHAVQGSAVACIVLNILAMIFYSGGVVIVAAIIGMVVSGGVIFFQFELQNEDCKLLIHIQKGIAAPRFGAFPHSMCVSPFSPPYRAE